MRRWLAERDLEIAVWSATQVQSVFRGWIARDSLEDNHYCAIQIQRTVRGYLATMHVFEDLYSITIVQSVVRRFLAMNLAVDRLSSIIAMQSWWQGIRTRDYLEEMEYSAVTVQASWRRYLAQMSYQFDVIDIIIVQSVVRRWKTRRVLAAVRLQCFARYVAANVLFDERLAEHNLALQRTSAIQIQARWRSYAAQMTLLKYIAATKIQSHWRGFVEKERYLLYIVARRIQAWWRCLMLRRRYVDYVSATKIQAHWRGFLAKERYLLYMSATKIQAHWRGFLAKERYLLYMSATKIQSLWRSYTAQVHMLISIVNVIVVQVRRDRVSFLLITKCDVSHVLIPAPPSCFPRLLHKPESLASACSHKTIQAALAPDQTCQGTQENERCGDHPERLARICGLLQLSHQEIRKQGGHHNTMPLACLFPGCQLLHRIL